MAFSVPATEHSVMTSLGPDGEMKIVLDLLDEYKQFLKGNGKLVALSQEERKQKREDGYTVDDFTPDEE